MATVEHHLISRIIRSGPEGLQTVLDYGISPNDFSTNECKATFIHLLEYYKDAATRNAVIGPNKFVTEFPHFELVDEPGMTVEAYCHEVRQSKLRRDVERAGIESGKLAQSDPIEAAKVMRQAADAIIASGYNQNEDVFLSRRIEHIVMDYELREQGGLINNILWPWELLNDITGGINDEDYVLLYGRPKSMKTFVLTYIMAMAYESGSRILCYTKEMTPDNMLLRIAAFLGRLPYQDIRMGTMTAEQKEGLIDLYKHIREQAEHTSGANDLIVLSGREAKHGDGVMWLQSKIEKYKPAACFVDGLYLMKDDRSTKRTSDWQRMTNISRDVRQMILDTGVPVIATMQANRKAAGHSSAELDEVAYADAVGQDITHAFRVINEKASPTIALVTAGAREYALHGIRINGVPCTDFEYLSELTERDVSKVQKADGVPEDAQDHSKPRKKPRLRTKKANDALQKQLKELK